MADNPLEPPHRAPVDQPVAARSLTSVAQTFTAQQQLLGITYGWTQGYTDGWFGPGRPMAPQAPADVAGRQWDFPAGVNITTQPRIYEGVTFEQLRALADNYDLLRVVLETRKDQIEALDWRIQPRDVRGQERDERCEKMEDFWRYPDGEHDWATWMRMLLEDQFVIDAATIFPLRARNGDVIALEPIDGATVKRLIDPSGRTPRPPLPAYQQILKGLPAVDYTFARTWPDYPKGEGDGADLAELIYLPRNVRTNKMYGYGPVEQIVMTIQIGMLRQLSQAGYYQEGNTPEALIGMPAGWSTTQISQFQAWWDGLLTPNVQMRRRTRFVPGEFKYQPTKDAMLKDEYDEWLARVICFAFSLPPTYFTKQNNRATAENAHKMAIEEGLKPLMQWIKRLVDFCLAKLWGFTDLEFSWQEKTEVDPVAQATIHGEYLQRGVLSIDEVRDELGLDPLGMSNAIFTAGGVIFIADLVAGDVKSIGAPPTPEEMAMQQQIAGGAPADGSDPADEGAGNSPSVDDMAKAYSAPTGGPASGLQAYGIDQPTRRLVPGAPPPRNRKRALTIDELRDAATRRPALRAYIEKLDKVLALASRRSEVSARPSAGDTIKLVEKGVGLGTVVERMGDVLLCDFAGEEVVVPSWSAREGTAIMTQTENAGRVWTVR